MNNKNNSNLEMVTEQTKTFNVYHIEDNGCGGDRYFNGNIEAKNIDEAEQIFKDEWVNPEMKDQIYEMDGDENSVFLTSGVEYFENGELISSERMRELVDKYKVDSFSDLLDEFSDVKDNVIEELGWIEHIYEIVLNED